MNRKLKGIWQHILDLGLGALAHANRHAAYAAMENARWPELSVLQAAHAAELIIKARIAQEHPLLIFDKLPSSIKSSGSALSLKDLLNEGRTFEWKDLPERLWAVTGQSIPSRATFDNFGKLRNSIQHFAPGIVKDPGGETLRFVFEVIDPFINQSWGLFAVDYDEDYERYVYFVHALISRKILFLVSPDAAAAFENWDTDWSRVSKRYKNEIIARVQKAKK
jgi:hypothetical protein